MALKKRTIPKITKKTLTRTVRRTIVPAVKRERFHGDGSLMRPGSLRRGEEVGDRKTCTTDGRVVKVTSLWPKGKQA